MPGYIGISRDIRTHWVYKDSDYFKAWFEMLCCARFAKKPLSDIEAGVPYTLKYGEFMFGYPSWSKRLNVGQQKLRTLIRLLLREKMIVLIKKHPKFTIYFVLNYEKYNNVLNNHEGQQNGCIDEDINNQPNKQPTSSQQPPNKQPTTKEPSSNKDNQDNQDNQDNHKRTALESAIDDFKEFRKKIKAPMTDRAVQLLKNELNKLAKDDDTKVAIINQSIVNGWKGVFPLKEGAKSKSTMDTLSKLYQEYGEADE